MHENDSQQNSTEPTTAKVSRRSFVAGAAALAGAAAIVGVPGVANAAPAVPSAASPAAPPANRPHSSGVGFVLSHEQFRTDELIGFATTAERVGFSSVWASDHTQPWQHNEGHSMFP